MLKYDRIDISEGTDLIKQVHQNSVIFLTIGISKYEPYLCKGCHDLLQKAVSFNNVAIVYIKGNAYRIHFWYMSLDDAISNMDSSDLIDKKGVF